MLSLRELELLSINMSICEELNNIYREAKEKIEALTLELDLEFQKEKGDRDYIDIIPKDKKEISRLVQLLGKEIYGKSREKRKIDNFLINEIFRPRFEGNVPKETDLPFEFVNLKTLSSEKWEVLEKSRIPEDFGKYTLNPEMRGLDFEKAEVEFVVLPDMVGRPFSDVVKVAMERYKDRIMPGAEYLMWLNEDKNRLERVIKERQRYYNFFGSLICTDGGYWAVSDFDGFDQCFSERDFGRKWNQFCVLVLLKK